MSERITEAEMVDLIRQAQASHPPAMAIAMRFYDEVRRLRGLIVAAEPDFPPSINEAVQIPQAREALRTEARAIREEQGR